MIYLLETQQLIPADLDTVWAFFAAPRNLNEITPPDLHFTFVRGGDEPMYAGQIIEYRVTVFPYISTRWVRSHGSDQLKTDVS
jgi:ligand-binding SRPBCC domain-containing protein